MVPQITSYPLFRLTLALAVGIFLSDQYLSEKSIWLYALAVMFCLICIGLYFLHRYALRFSFGVCACLAMAVLGALLVGQQRQRIAYEWPKDEALYIGRVESVPVQRESARLVTLRVEGLKIDSASAWIPVDRNIQLLYLTDSASVPLQYADKLCFYAKAGRPAEETALTGFDYGRYLECQGISGTAVAFASRWKKLGHDDRFSLRGVALQWREKLLATYRSWQLDKDVLAVASALTLGDKSKLTRQLKGVYTAAGTSHVLALSGLHVGILSLILSWLLFPLRLVRGGKWVISFCVVGVLWSFAFLTGLSPSVVRAVTMFSLYVVASIVSDSRYTGSFAVVLTAFIMLLCRPLYLFDIGFQLSFAAVISILLFMPLFQQLWSPRNKVAVFLWNTLALSLSAQIGTAPIILYTFGTFPTYFLLANLFVTPLAVLILASSLLALCISSVPFVGPLSVMALSKSTLALTGVMKWVYGLHGAQITSVYFSAFQSVLLVLSLLFLYLYLLKPRFKRLLLTLLALNVLTASLIVEHLFPPTPSIGFGRGGIYMQCGRETSRLEPVLKPCRIGPYTMLQMNDDRWKNKQTESRMPVDYIYVCRGFRGSVSDIQNLFSTRCVLLDAWLSDWFRDKLKAECHELGVNYLDLSEQTFRLNLSQSE